MSGSVLDSSAFLAYLFKEKGYEQVVTLLEQAAKAERHVLISSPNWAEIRAIVEKKAGSGRWPEVCEKVAGLPVEVVPADRSLAEVAGEFRVRWGLSLGDCFAAALAHSRKANLLTGDHDFKRVESDIKVVWL